MGLIRALNGVSSQVWAVILILLGLSAFLMASHTPTQDVRQNMMAAATGMIGAGLAMFQHQPKDGETTTTIQTTPQQQEK